MDSIIVEFLNLLQFGELKLHQNMAVVPLFYSPERGPQYLTLKEALEKKLLTITEVSQAGSVPDLKVVNQADIPVLLLDGEELAGAKQNRVLNTTILLKERSETIIPVSCTEQGRWAYRSHQFEESGYVTDRRVRVAKLASVTHSLKQTRTYRSNQEAVWREVSFLTCKIGVDSPTGAMRDLFAAKEDDLTGYLDAFPHFPDQKGIFVMVDGKPVGFDVVSRSHAYEQLHQKLVKSYAMDALVRQGKMDSPPSVEKAKSFLQEATGCQEKRYESIGYGWDHRFEGKAIVGSCLVHQETVIHMAFFQTVDSERAERISSASHRRRFRL